MLPEKYFTQKLLYWNLHQNNRLMPWKGEKDPYKIWLSEIILQQTRVEQGWAYYEKFISKFPTIEQLAKAKDEFVFKMWEGLGYYNRCKNLLETARHITDKFDAVFPSSYEEIINLKGIGAYTASAISSFAFNLPYAVVDGNVYRILARYFAIDKNVDTSEAKKYFSVLAQSLLSTANAGLYNQAIMDFGATICKPAQPLCNKCILQKHCKAFINNTVSNYPVKKKKELRKVRWFNYFIFTYENDVYIKKRIANDIWKNLHEYYLIETKEGFIEEENIKVQLKEIINSSFSITTISANYKQILTHQLIHCRFVNVQLKTKIVLKDFMLVNEKQIMNYAFPKTLNVLANSK